MRPEDRERLIVEGAVKFFAEFGFSGDTRELARRLGVTQPLLFRYFPNKEALIERVYQEVFVRRWNPYWEILLDDRKVPLEQRLIAFYKDYARTILDRDWLRIFMFAGLKGSDINQRFLGMLRERTLVPICRELRREFGLPSLEAEPLTEFEVELVWGINGRILYLGIRKWIYQTPVPEALDPVIESSVKVFFEGAKAVIGEHLSGGRLKRATSSPVPRPRLKATT